MSLASAGCERASNAELGRVQFERYCESCHAIDGSSRGGAPDLRRLARKYGTPLPHDEIAAWIDGRRGSEAHGTRDMPVWGDELYETFPANESTETVRTGTIHVLVEYLDSIQRTD
ncbi:MAG: hypothetical protein DCC71_24225 [Proteobacteria bacterium]|nr:MAG: hypothetical protein DCC71_24225 [Pseudomonadota bacterium]